MYKLRWMMLWLLVPYRPVEFEKELSHAPKFRQIADHCREIYNICLEAKKKKHKRVTGWTWKQLVLDHLCGNSPRTLVAFEMHMTRINYNGLHSTALQWCCQEHQLGSRIERCPNVSHVKYFATSYAVKARECRAGAEGWEHHFQLNKCKSPGGSPSHGGW